MQSQTHFTIGSAEDVDIRICQPTVSQHHCELQWKGNAWVISDCDSTNGTFINGSKISEPACLGPDDRVTLGRGVKLDIPSPPQVPKVSHMSQASQRSPLLSRPTQHRPRIAMLLMLGGIGVLCLLCGVVLISFWLSPTPSLSGAGEANTVRIVEGRASESVPPQSSPDAPSKVSAQTTSTD
ncbi:MAG: FHA domain-containing protein [Planctomycetales bacterium]|nr:FHA domain-containing protein [Planctomycetales bacterium]